MQKQIKIGTRGSPLALQQANKVKQSLLTHHGHLQEKDIEICIIKVLGDHILDRSFMAAGGKGLFTKEIEEALLREDIDMAVHSTKDVPTTLPEGLGLACFLERDDPRDAFIAIGYDSLDDLPVGALVGTASLRRRAQLLRYRPDMKVINFRGNIQTRLKKLEAGEVNATFLALAGLQRMGLEKIATAILPLDGFLPAPAQGAITIEVRETDKNTKDLLYPLHHLETAHAILAERALLAALDGSCKTPIAAYAHVKDEILHMSAEILSVDGDSYFTDSIHVPINQSLQAATSLGEKIRKDAGTFFFQKLVSDVEALS